jgi:predicted  nucleic acid-binding Zn-ribbon protein
MSGPVETLRELHRLRRHAKDLQTEIDRIPRQLKVQQARIAQQEAAAKEAHDSLKRLKVSNHEKEVLLKQTQQQIAKHERQLNEAGSKKEYDALKVEIAADKEKCKQYEDEILNGMMEIDERTARLPEADKAAAQAKVDYAQFEKDQQTRQVSLTEQLAATERTLTEVEATLPDDVLTLYRRQVSARNEDAMAAVQGRTCVACYTEITAQSYNDLLAGRLVICKACGRILYLPE